MMISAEDKPHASESFQKRKRFCRSAALQLLFQMDLGEDWDLTHEEFLLFWEQFEKNGALPDFNCPVRQLRRDVRKLLNLVLENREDVDEKLSAATEKWTLQRMTVIDRNILRLGLAEMLFNEKVPRNVAINEAIELAREFGDKESPAFVNGLLDRF